MYLFLAAVSDQHGLSFYRDTTIAGRLRIREQAVVEAREELVLRPGGEQGLDFDGQFAAVRADLKKVS